MKTGVIRELHKSEARRLTAYHDWEMPEVYTSVEEEFAAAMGGAALIDHSLYGRIEVEGADGIDLLHRLSTNDLLSLRQGQIIPTILTTDKGRLVDYVKVARRSPASLMVVSPNNEQTVIHWIDRYCITEDVRLHCVTSDTAMFTIMGPRSQAVASAVVGVDLASGMSLEARAGNAPVIAGFVETPRVQMAHFLARNEDAESAWRHITREGERLGLVRIGALAYETFRIARGIPDIEREISGEFNPYDVGLRDAISYTKGCYIGQEVIARLDTYQKIRKMLVGLLLPAPCSLDAGPAGLFLEGTQVGVMTSCSPAPVKGRYLGLGVVRNDLVKEGETLTAGQQSLRAIVITTPILL